jgi:hypothetical protein
MPDDIEVAADVLQEWPLNRWEGLVEPTWLILSGLGAERPSESFIGLLRRLIESRLSRPDTRTTLLSVLTGDEFEARYPGIRGLVVVDMPAWRLWVGTKREAKVVSGT